MFRQDPSTYGVPNLAADIMDGAAPTPAAAPDRVGALEAAVLYLQQRAARLEYRVAELERNQKTRARPSEQDVYQSQEAMRRYQEGLRQQQIQSYQSLPQRGQNANMGQGQQANLCAQAQQGQYLGTGGDGNLQWLSPAEQANAVGQAQAALQSANIWNDFNWSDSAKSKNLFDAHSAPTIKSLQEAGILPCANAATGATAEEMGRLFSTALPKQS